jgi:hypothetical protein
LDGAGWAIYAVGLAVVDKTKGCCVEGRCVDDVKVGTAFVESTSVGGRDDDNDEVDNVGTAFVDRTKGGREDDGVLVGIAVVESVMGGSEEVELVIGLW